MDDLVKQAMAKWPNVPDAYGWLGLGMRGDWYLRDEAAQAAVSDLALRFGCDRVALGTLRRRQMRVQAISGDRNGLGIAVYTGAPRDELETDPAVIAAAEKADLERGLAVAKASRSGEYAGAAIPHGASLEFKGVVGELPDLDKPIRYYDEQMASSALAHFLNLGKQTGSWALGTTFADFFALSLQTVALHIADVATQHIVEDLVDLNWGEGEPTPRIVFDEIGSQSPPTADALQSLVQTKVIRPDDTLEDFMRRRYGLPEADIDTAREIRAVPAGEKEQA